MKVPTVLVAAILPLATHYNRDLRQYSLAHKVMFISAFSELELLHLLPLVKPDLVVIDYSLIENSNVGFEHYPKYLEESVQATADPEENGFVLSSSSLILLAKSSDQASQLAGSGYYDRITTGLGLCDDVFGQLFAQKILPVGSLSAVQ